MGRIFLALALLAASITGAAAQSSGQTQPYKVATKESRIAPRTNILPWLPFSNNVAQIGGTFGSTHDNLVVLEAPDDYVAVLPIFMNKGGSSWTLGGAVVSPSASYGAITCGTNCNPGITPYDVVGNAQNAMLPVTFNNSGSYVEPYTSQAFPINGSGQPPFVVALQTTGATTGATTLPFNSTTAGNAQYGNIPATGMYVFDALGCIQANTTVQSVGSNSLTISPGVSGTTACASGQSIYFSWTNTPSSALSATITATTNSPMPNLYFGDWIPAQSLPRNDGGEVVGMSVGGTNIQAGTKISAVNQTQVTLTQNPSGTIAQGSAITFTVAPVVATTALSGAYKIYVQPGQVFGLKPGEIVTGSASIPSNSWISEVNNDSGGSYIRLNNALTGSISASTTLTATLTSYLVQAASSTSPILQFASTTSKPLLVLRAVQSGSSASNGWGSNTAAWKVQQLNLPIMYDGAGGTSVDGVNFVGNITNASQGSGSFPNGGSFLYGMLFLTRHAGVSIMVVGDSHMCGTSTVTGDANYAELAAYALSTSTVPVSAFQACFGGTSWGQFDWLASKYISAFKPTLMVIPSFTFNTTPSPQAGLNAALSLARTMQTYGGVTIMPTDYVRQSPYVMPVVVSQAVNASATVPISVYPPAAFSGAAVTGAGIPGGTTASYTVPSNNTCGPTGLKYDNTPCNFLTLSTPVTLSAGQVLRFDQMTVASNVNNSTAVTFTTPAAATLSTNTVASGTGISGTPSISITVNSTSATLGTAQTLTAGTVLSIGTTTVGIGNEEMAEALTGMMANGTIQTFYPNAVLEDPNNPTFFLPQYSYDGIHANDNGHAAVTASFRSVLQQAIGK